MISTLGRCLRDRVYMWFADLLVAGPSCRPWGSLQSLCCVASCGERLRTKIWLLQRLLNNVQPWARSQCFFDRPAPIYGEGGRNSTRLEAKAPSSAEIRHVANKTKSTKFPILPPPNKSSFWRSTHKCSHPGALRRPGGRTKNGLRHVWGKPGLSCFAEIFPTGTHTIQRWTNITRIRQGTATERRVKYM